MRRRAAFLAVLLLAGACSRGERQTTEETAVFDPGPAPAAASGPLSSEADAALDDLFAAATTYGIDPVALQAVADAEEPRAAWFVADLLRFFPGDPEGTFLADAFESLTGVRPDDARAWTDATDHLIAWDLAAPPGYVARKAELHEAVDPRWAPLFADPEATVDWRLVSWGGVHIDDRDQTRRPDGSEQRCSRGCIPALIDPGVTDADAGAWLDDDRRVFGLEVDGEHRAYPLHQLETHEMVHDELGGRRLALSFCTLCRSAQAYYVDDVAPEVRAQVAGSYDLRTSGLLHRSNKLTYERHTQSLVDTFTGAALSGPLREAGVRLEPVTVVTSTWGSWRTAHPDTTVVAEDGGIGREYDLDPLGARDDDGPIFPVGDTDPRLPVQEQVLGVIAPDGSAVAFPIVDLTAARRQGDRPGAAGVRVVRDGDGFRAEDVRGRPLVSHEAFWFAWSQFRPDTTVWSP